MGLFTKDEKKAKPKFNIEDLPEFPEMPNSAPDLPAYKPSLTDIKQEVGKPEEMGLVDIPKRTPREVPRISVPKIERPVEEAPVRRLHGKPLFVKIDKYKSALSAIDVLKVKITEAEKCLHEIDSIREQEDQKLAKWKADIEKLKDKLLEIDSNLFEV